MEAHIYSIRAPDGRQYVGSTTESITRRFQRHKSRALTGERPNSRLHNAMGSTPEGFTLELLQTVPISDRLQTEAHFIRTLKTTFTGFNTQVPGRTRAQWRADASRGGLGFALRGIEGA